MNARGSKERLNKKVQILIYVFSSLGFEKNKSDKKQIMLVIMF